MMLCEDIAHAGLALPSRAVGEGIVIIPLGVPRTVAELALDVPDHLIQDRVARDVSELNGCQPSIL